ncbi:hypothetical protein VSAK1_05645 [Vibrio mediterranei AK1]|uniref:STAS/SEC14 domain-containing protein n=1 Tax=Vibrio mediterranei TaxID=689 RepID=UPI0001542937|nr:STAS/SEC14 domain-containing protein [Vibrio mediterranei]EDL52097.1 hypothetical protein VSAK1_05645 [Vibrio mediterranei AK1]
MFTTLPSPRPDILVIEFDDNVDLVQEKHIIAEVDKLLAEHERISVMAILDESANWSLAAGFKDIVWTLTNLKRIEKVAIVADSKVITWLVSADAIIARMFDIQEKAFASADFEQAWNWIQAPK